MHTAWRTRRGRSASSFGVRVSGPKTVTASATGSLITNPNLERSTPVNVTTSEEVELRQTNVAEQLLREVPVVLLAYDLLEAEGNDLREQTQLARRDQLDALVAEMNHPQLIASPVLQGDSWTDLAQQREAARQMGTEGFMLKQREARYGVGRTRSVGTWWKWKIDPLSVDAVLIYAQRGHGRRASLYSDYTFAVWNAPPGTEGRQLVPFAKAYSGLTDAEMAKVDAIIRKTTVESFGPVRSVRPTLVFELGFEGIGRSTRHKSGIAVRFPRMLRWRTDKKPEDADSLETILSMLDAQTVLG